MTILKLGDNENYCAQCVFLTLNAIALFEVLFADFLPTLFSAYADQRLLLYFLVISSVPVFFWQQVKSRYARLDVNFFLPLLIFILSVTIGSIWPTASRFGSVESVFYIAYFLAFTSSAYLIVQKNIQDVAISTFATVVGVACFFYAAMTLTVYLFAILDEFSNIDDVIPWGFVNIRYWSHIATWLIPVFPLLLLGGRSRHNKSWRFAVFFTAGIWWWLVFLTVSRGSMVGLFAGFAFVNLFFGKAVFPWSKLILKFFGFGLFVWIVFSIVVPSLVFDDIQIRSVSSDTSGRLPLWGEAWAMSLQNFPFGMGAQSWLTHDTLTDAYSRSSKFGHPHNMYLMWAAEYGWISIVGLFVIGGFGLKRLWHCRSAIRSGREQRWMPLFACTASVIGALVHAGVSAVFIAPGSMLVGLLVLSVFWALINSPVHSEQAIVANRPKFFIFKKHQYCLVAAVTLSCALWFCVVLDYHHAMLDDQAFYQKELKLKNLPRFWLHGYFPRETLLMPPKELAR